VRLGWGGSTRDCMPGSCSCPGRLVFDAAAPENILEQSAFLSEAGALKAATILQRTARAPLRNGSGRCEKFARASLPTCTQRISLLSSSGSKPNSASRRTTHGC
jgi:hypothetical protein